MGIKLSNNTINMFSISDTRKFKIDMNGVFIIFNFMTTT